MTNLTEFKELLEGCKSNLYATKATSQEAVDFALELLTGKGEPNPAEVVIALGIFSNTIVQMVVELAEEEIAKDAPPVFEYVKGAELCCILAADESCYKVGTAYEIVEVFGDGTIFMSDENGRSHPWGLEELQDPEWDTRFIPIVPTVESDPVFYTELTED